MSLTSGGAKEPRPFGVGVTRDEDRCTCCDLLDCGREAERRAAEREREIWWDDL